MDVPEFPSPRPWAAWRGWATARRLQRRPPLRFRAHSAGPLRMRSPYELGVDWARLTAPELAVYMPGQIRHMIRFEGSLGRAEQTLEFPTVPAAWLHPLPPDPTPPPLPRPPERVPTEAASPWPSALARALPAGACLLGLLALLVHAADKYFHKNIFKLRRRRSAEWPTPHVLALATTDGARADPPRGAPPSPAPSGDAPPAYWQVAGRAVLHKSDTCTAADNEDPPPPYSACFVSFSLPEGGSPSAHFHNQRQEPSVTTTGHCNPNSQIQDSFQTQNSTGHIETEFRTQNSSNASGDGVLQRTQNRNSFKGQCNDRVQKQTAIQIQNDNNGRSDTEQNAFQTQNRMNTGHYDINPGENSFKPQNSLNNTSLYENVHRQTAFQTRNNLNTGRYENVHTQNSNSTNFSDTGQATVIRRNTSEDIENDLTSENDRIVENVLNEANAIINEIRRDDNAINSYAEAQLVSNRERYFLA